MFNFVVGIKRWYNKKEVTNSIKLVFKNVSRQDSVVVDKY